MADTKKFDYRYPLSKLTESDDYLKISILKYTPPGFGSSDDNTLALPSAGEVGGYDKVVPEATVILPIPDAVQDTNSTTWGASEIGPLAALSLGVGQNVVRGNFDDLTQLLSDVGGVAKTGTAQKALQALGINFATNVLLGQNRDLNQVASRYAGIIANSNIELIFSSVNLRQPFSFGFDIVPRSEKESQMVKQIIRKLKYHSAAKKSIGAASGLFLKAPEVFKLEYMNGNRPHPFLNRFKICALQNIAVNYAGSGTYATYGDATPVHMTLGLTFQELTPIYAEDYNESIGLDGTGY